MSPIKHRIHQFTKNFDISFGGLTYLYEQFFQSHPPGHLVGRPHFRPQQRGCLMLGDLDYEQYYVHHLYAYNAGPSSYKLVCKAHQL